MPLSEGTSLQRRSGMTYVVEGFHSFYRAMHYSAKRGLAIACRQSVCPSVTLVDQDHKVENLGNCAIN